MPTESELLRIKKELKARAKKLHLGKARTGAYVYGTLRKIRENPTKSVKVLMGKKIVGGYFLQITTSKPDSTKWLSLLRDGYEPLGFLRGFNLQAEGPYTQKIHLEALSESKE